MKGRAVIIFLFLFLFACVPSGMNKTVSLGGGTYLYVTDNSVVLYSAGKEIFEIKGTVSSLRELKTYFFGGSTKFEKKYIWERVGEKIKRVSGRVVEWNNGVKMNFSLSGKNIVKIEASGNGNALKLIFSCRSNDHFLGFGAQTIKSDQKGEYIPVWTSEEGLRKLLESDVNPLWMVVGNRHSSYYPLPYFYNPAGFGFLVDTPYLTEFDLCHNREDQWSMEGDTSKLKIYVLIADSPKRSVEIYTDLTGKPLLPQKWYFSPWNDAVGGEDRVLEVARIIRENHIPSAVIWTEDWGGGVKRGKDGSYSFTYNWDLGRDLYPHFETMVAELHRMGFHFLVYFNSFVDSKSRIWNEIPHDYLIKHEDGSPYMMLIPTLDWGSILDLTNPAAWEWAENKMKKAIEMGVDGWMADYGEWLPYDSRVAEGEGKKFHNLYPLLWHRLNLEVMEKYSDERNFVYFTRSGYIGDQALTPVYWPGDQSTDFAVDDGLPTAIAVAVNLSWSGMLMYGSDIAGYMSLGNPPSDRELFIRWTEFGAFSPVMRTHHGYFAFKNWNFYRDQYTLNWYRFYAIWHQRLFPYLYSEAVTEGKKGIPLIRHMLMEFPEDASLYDMPYQYMLGPFLLVAPVIERGARHRILYLPRGKWYDFWEKWSVNSRGEWIEANAPLERIPVFVRDGAILELIAGDIDTISAFQESENVVTLEGRNNWREVWVFPGEHTVKWKDYEGNEFVNSVVNALDLSTLKLNSQYLKSCEGNSPPCFYTLPQGVKIRVKSKADSSIEISDDRGNRFEFIPAVERWWDLVVYGG